MQNYSDLFNKIKISVVGFGVSAFPRLIPALFLKKYQIVSALESSELRAIKNFCSVKSLENDFGNPCLEKKNTSAILATEAVKDFLAGLPDPKAAFVYKSSRKIEKILEELNFGLLASPAVIRDPYENKKDFRILGQKAGIKLPEGETILVDDLTEDKFNQFMNRFESLVFQLPDYKIGGGIGTFFIRGKEDYLNFLDFVKRRRAFRKIDFVNVTQFKTGMPASIAACVTKKGVLVGTVQFQIMDQEELVALKGRNGVWCGHDWTIRFSEKIQQQANEIGRKLGEQMARDGYRGIFGIDLVVNQEEEVWPIECNARYTGAFPVFSMAQIINEEIPLDIFHFAEFLDVDFGYDFDEVNRKLKQPKQGSQILLHNLEKKFLRLERVPLAGLWKYDSEESAVVWQKDACFLSEISDAEKEFILTDRIPPRETVIKPAERLGRLIFRQRVIDPETGKLLPEIKKIVNLIYEKYQFSKAENPNQTES